MNVFLAQEAPSSESLETGMTETLDMVKNLEFDKLLDLALNWLLKVGPKVLFAVIFLFIGIKIADIIAKISRKTMQKAKVDESLSQFLANVFGFVLKIFVLILAANIIGIPISSFIAILGAAGLAIGLALKDGLSNFAGGVVLLLFKPIKVGDLITVEGHHGFVKAISLFYTIIETKNNHTVTIPNGSVSNGDVVNFSTQPLVRVQALVGIGYQDDIKKARRIMLEQTLKDERIARDPEPFVVLKELGDNSVNLELRCYSEARPFRRVLFQLLENIKEAFDANGISIPYPQRDLHIINDSDDSGSSQSNPSLSQPQPTAVSPQIPRAVPQQPVPPTPGNAPQDPSMGT